MAPLESFQSRSFRFSLQILRLYRRIVALAPVPQHILNQFLRAGTAIGSNLEEAKAAHSKRDLAAKQVIALRGGPRMPLLASPGARRPTETGTRSRASARRKRSDHCDPDSFSPKAACHICR